MILIKLSMVGKMLMNNKFFKIKKLLSDFSNAMIATALMVCSLQLIVYPYLAKTYSSEVYGVILTTMGIINAMVGTLANSLNNIRLILNSKYEKHNVEGDFNVLLFFSTILGVIVIIIVFIGLKLNDSNNLSLFLLIILLVVTMLRTYFLVYYRIKLNFIANMICCLIISVGYIVGAYLVRITKYWPLAFISGEFLGCLFLFLNTPLYKESFSFTIYFKDTLKEYVILILTFFVANFILYLDRLLLYPALGGQAVTNYTVASFFGKTLEVLVIPLSNVLLAHYSQNGFYMDVRRFWKINIISIAISGVFFIVSIFLSSWITGLLYPTVIEEARPYILLANLSVIINIAGNMTQPAILRFSKRSWQLVIQIIYGFTYITLGLYLLKSGGLYGFCIATVVANGIRLMTMYIIGTLNIKGCEG